LTALSRQALTDQIRRRHRGKRAKILVPKVAGRKGFHKEVITRARKSIAGFKLRQGRAIGAKVTLRGDRMWAFLDRLCNIALPRQRDFRGVPAAFDGRGNITIGLHEQLVFPEIDYDEIDRVRGMEICIVTTARTDEEGRRLMTLLGMPFRRQG